MKNRTARLLCACFCVIASTAVLAVTPPLHAQTESLPQPGRINAAAVRARQSADLASPIVFSPAKDAVVQVLARDGVWSQIKLGDRVGFVRTSVITMSPASTAAPATSPTVASAPPAAAAANPATRPPAAAPPASAPPVTSSPPPATQRAATASTASAPPAAPPVRQDTPREPPPPAAEKSTSASSTVGERRGSPSHLLAAGVSYTPAEDPASGGVATETGAHIAGNVILQLSKGPIGVLGLGAYGTGTGYKSQFANAALSLALLRAGRLRFDLLGGGAYYTEQLILGDTKADAATGAMAGAMLTLPFIGPLRGTVLGSYMIGKWSDDAVLHAGDARFFRIVVGLGF